MKGKIGIISDTHGNLHAWELAWDLVLRDCDLICHCGDLLYHGPKFKPAEAYNPKALADALNRQCLKREMTPADVAKVVVFLSSDEAGGCTNQDFVVDGGWV